MNNFYTKINSFINNHIIWFIFAIFLLNSNNTIDLIKALIYKDSIYDTQGIGVLLSTFLTIITIYFALVAFKASQKSNEISFVALESERPRIKFSFLSCQHFTLENIGGTDAIGITVIVKLKDKTSTILINDLNISPNVENELTPPKNGEIKTGYCSIIIIYKNTYNISKTYLQGYEIDLSENGTKQIKSSEGLIKYADYLNLYREKDIISNTSLIEKFLSL